MKQNIGIAVLLIIITALAIVVVQQNRQAAQLKEQLAAATAGQAKAMPVPEPQNDLPEPPPETVPAGAASVATLPPAPASAPSPATPSGSGSASNFFAGLAGMMKDPQMKEAIRVQQKMALDKMYGSLSKYLTLPADKLDALKELMADRQLAMTEAGMTLMSGSGDQKKAAEDAKTIKEDYDKKIQDLLGPQDYPVFQDYEKTVGDRTQVQMFKDTLPADAALTEQQEDDLITAMYEERNALPASSLMNNQTPDASQMTEERVAETLKQLEQLRQRYAERAATILTPAQLEQFTKWQQQFSAMQAAGLKMASQMFGNKSAPAPPAASQGPTP
jgi:hypothetical protein